MRCPWFVKEEMIKIVFCFTKIQGGELRFILSHYWLELVRKLLRKKPQCLSIFRVIFSQLTWIMVLVTCIYGFSDQVTVYIHYILQSLRSGCQEEIYIASERSYTKDPAPRFVLLLYVSHLEFLAVFLVRTKFILSWFCCCYRLTLLLFYIVYFMCLLF